MTKLDRAFRVSDGLTRLAGKKIKAAVHELQKEDIITSSEAKTILRQMSKVKHSIYDTVSRELKKIVSQAKGKKSTAKKPKAKRK